MTIDLNEGQERAFENAAEAVRADVEAGRVDAEIPDRGPAAGDVPKGEVVRILAEAYSGELELSND